MLFCEQYRYHGSTELRVDVEEGPPGEEARAWRGADHRTDVFYWTHRRLELAGKCELGFDGVGVSRVCTAVQLSLIHI